LTNPLIAAPASGAVDADQCPAARERLSLRKTAKNEAPCRIGSAFANRCRPTRDVIGVGGGGCHSRSAGADDGGSAMTKPAVIDTTVQKTHEWLGEITQRLGFDNERAAYAALRATLHALRDRLAPEAVAHFGAELPMLIRGLYYEGWHPSAERLRSTHDEDFLDSVRRELTGHDELQDTGRVVRVVLGILEDHLAASQIEHILAALPKDVRVLWREAVEEESDLQ
jgi:uncharacterized protein (DUF2267 family)